MNTIKLDYGWKVCAVVDDDLHLNLYIKNTDQSDIIEIDTGQGDGVDEQYAIRLTTATIEEESKLTNCECCGEITDGTFACGCHTDDCPNCCWPWINTN